MRHDIKTYMLGAALCAAALAGCSREPSDGGLTAGDTPISLQGVSTRIGASGEERVYLIAYNEDDTTKVYFPATRIRSAATLGTTPSEFTFPTEPRYYPLGGRDIHLIAFTGEINDRQQMRLNAGQEPVNDYILSNYGRRQNDPGSDTDMVQAYETTGTPGSSTDPAHVLQFRHVMTQLNVEVEVDDQQTNPVDSPPEIVEFTIDGLMASGRYSIRSPEPVDGAPDNRTAAPNGTAPYTAKLGVNYLVPTGLNLAKQHFSSLVIDNYKATDTDLAGFEITGTNGETNMPLLPGYAYTLTIKVQKLGVSGVQLTRVPWVERELTDSLPTFDPNRLALDITGGYSNRDEDKITKVVLHSAQPRQYVGEADGADDLINFVTLPQGQVDSVDLYTSRGLLMSMALDGTEYSANTLSLELSPVGMLLEQKGQPNSESNPYRVTTLVQFMNIDKEPSGHFRQENDLEFEELEGLATEFNGLGDFSGTYDGNGFLLGNVNISAPGLFASNSGKLKNVRVYSGNIDLAGQPYGGGICGRNTGLIYACVNEASLFDSDDVVGGIAGLNGAGGRIIASVNTGNIRSGDVMGGICGENLNPAERAVAACISTGHIADADATVVGGIIGRSVDSGATVIGTCFWLVGSVQAVPGQHESAVGQGTLGQFDTSDLDPAKMRDGLDEGETEPDRIVNRLNREIVNVLGASSEFLFIYDRELTGITWPMPVDRTLIP